MRTRSRRCRSSRSRSRQTPLPEIRKILLVIKIENERNHSNQLDKIVIYKLANLVHPVSLSVPTRTTFFTSSAVLGSDSNCCWQPLNTRSASAFAESENSLGCQTNMGAPVPMLLLHLVKVDLVRCFMFCSPPGIVTMKQPLFKALVVLPQSIGTSSPLLSAKALQSTRSPNAFVGAAFSLQTWHEFLAAEAEKKFSLQHLFY
jgi:hypothetical protein